jgi:hypothetical protein
MVRNKIDHMKNDRYIFDHDVDRTFIVATWQIILSNKLRYNIAF